MFYDRFAILAHAKGVSVFKATQDIGLSNSTAAKWKRTGATPDGKTLQRIAAYFGVTIDSLLSDETKETPAQGGGDKKAVILDSINAILGTDSAINFDVSNITEEDLEILRDQVEADVKMMEKRIQRRQGNNE